MLQRNKYCTAEKRPKSAVILTIIQRCSFRDNALRCTPIISDAGSLGNECRVIPDQAKLALCSEWLKHVAALVMINVRAKNGAGLALEKLAVMLSRLDVT